MKSINERKENKVLLLCNMGKLHEVAGSVYDVCQRFICKRVIALQKFLRDDAINADNNNNIRLYFIYDKEVKMLAGYYTLTSTCMLRKAEDGAKENTKYEFEKIVSKVVPSIEIEHFALNDEYLKWLKRNGYNNKGIGYFIYQQYVKNTIIAALENIAFSYVILHAYKHDKVIDAYRNMGFETYEDDKENIIPILDGLTPIRGDYADTCKFMYQSIEDILLY